MRGYPDTQLFFCDATIVAVRGALAGAFFGVAAAVPVQAQVTQNVLLNFNYTNGSYPTAPMLADTTGRSGALRGLYGAGGGAPGDTNVFKLTSPKKGNINWNDSILWTEIGSGSNLTLSGFGPLFSFSQHISKSSALYGTTEFGGNVNYPCGAGDGYQGCGTIYGVTGNAVSVLWAFTGGADGGEPYDGVIGDKSGALYTTTDFGGGVSSCGTVDKLTPPAPGNTAWTETTLWAFANGNDGCLPYSLVRDKAGALYGLADGGSTGDGTVFKLVPPGKGKSDWTEQTLWTFQGSDGNTPFGLTIGRGGVFYIVSISGGSARDGTVVALTPPAKIKTAWTEQVIWNFTGGADGAFPVGPVIIDGAGALYATAEEGGNQAGICADYGGCGTVLKLSPPSNGQAAWTETTLWTFSGGNDGSLPQAALTADNAGTLYGTASGGGANGYGVVFDLTGTGFEP